MKTIVYVCESKDIPDNEFISDENVIKYGKANTLGLFELSFNCGMEINVETQYVKFVEVEDNFNTFN